MLKKSLQSTSDKAHLVYSTFNLQKTLGTVKAKRRVVLHRPIFRHLSHKRTTQPAHTNNKQLKINNLKLGTPLELEIVKNTKNGQTCSTIIKNETQLKMDTL